MIRWAAPRPGRERVPMRCCPALRIMCLPFVTPSGVSNVGMRRTLMLHRAKSSTIARSTRDLTMRFALNQQKNGLSSPQPPPADFHGIDSDTGDPRQSRRSRAPSTQLGAQIPDRILKLTLALHAQSGGLPKTLAQSPSCGLSRAQVLWATQLSILVTPY